ncbi:superoxide dismutase family protein [Marinococcus halophilus]|uniref:superoxide dismutase family protein n=1 Tax=Marinococcus halophilus TaxID=1371 RepID=UPI001FD16153|nr:superoxide dismutase family protein [Marinococcus halophilus]
MKVISKATVGAVATSLFVMAGCSGGNDSAQEEQTEDQSNNENSEEDTADAEAELMTADETSAGTVSFTEQAEYTEVRVEAENLNPGHHGFHIHEEAVCEPEEEEPFSSAGGHFNPDDEDHPNHAGDMPSLYVNEDGTATMSFTTDRFTADQLVDEETAVMVHSNADNFANVPERYQSENADESGLDTDTLDTGDAGSREACGPVSS